MTALSPVVPATLTSLSPDQVQQYLNRLDIFEVPADPGVEFLDALIEAHQLNIPFENIDCALRKQAIIPLDTQSLFEKVVVNQRGGYCYELNALFHALLINLGYNAYPVLARVIVEAAPTPLDHRGEIVCIDGQRRYVDVGFGGPSPACSLLVAEGSVRESYGKTFTIAQAAKPGWWMLSYFTETGTKDVISFQQAPAEEMDFEPLSFYSASHPDSALARVLTVNKRTQTGHISITGHTFTCVDDSARTTEECNDGRLVEVLRTEFGIRL